MVKHTQAIRRVLPTNCLSVFDHFVELALKGLRKQPFPGVLQKSCSAEFHKFHRKTLMEEYLF